MENQRRCPQLLLSSRSISDQLLLQNKLVSIKIGEQSYISDKDFALFFLRKLIPHDYHFLSSHYSATLFTYHYLEDLKLTLRP